MWVKREKGRLPSGRFGILLLQYSKRIYSYYVTHVTYLVQHYTTQFPSQKQFRVDTCQRLYLLSWLPLTVQTRKLHTCIHCIVHLNDKRIKITFRSIIARVTRCHLRSTVGYYAQMCPDSHSNKPLSAVRLHEHVHVPRFITSIFFSMRRYMHSILAAAYF